MQAPRRRAYGCSISTVHILEMERDEPIPCNAILYVPGEEMQGRDWCATSTGRALNVGANFRGSPSICAGLSGSSEGALPRAEAGSTPASPSRDTIANMVAGSFQVMFHFSRNHPPVQPFDLGRGRNNWGVRFATVFAFLDFRIVMLAAGMYLHRSSRPRF